MGKSKKIEKTEVEAAPKKARKSRAAKKPAAEVAAENLANEGGEAEVLNFPAIVPAETSSGEAPVPQGEALPPSQVEHLRARKVGQEDLGAVALWLGAFGNGYFGAHVPSDELTAAIGLALGNRYRGEHGEAARKVMGVYRFVRDNHPDFLEYELECRDGTNRTIGYILQWYARTHWSAADKIVAALESEAAGVESAHALAVAVAAELKEIPADAPASVKIVTAKKKAS